MDRTYSSPRSAANATAEDVARALHRVVRAGPRRANFIFKTDFEYSGGRRGPLLMIGALRGEWREYVRRNAGASTFAAGECMIRAADGRAELCLKSERGRGGNSINARLLNAGLLRGTGTSVRFVDELPASSEGKAAAVGANAEKPVSPEASSTTTTPAAMRPPPVAGSDDGVQRVAAILRAFKDFRDAPTAAKLEALQADIARWKDLAATLPPESMQAKGAQQVAAIARLLDEKGRAYVAGRQSRPAPS